MLTAYEQLLHEGYLEGRRGSGTYVRPGLPDDAFRPALVAHRSPPPTRSDPRLTRVATETLRPFEGGLRPFRTSLPALDVFPHAVWARLVSRHAHRLSASQMAYGDPAGVRALRVAIAEHLRTARAVRCEAEQVLITTGSQAALRLCAAVLLEPGDRAAIEEPGYPGAQAAFRADNATLEPVPVDAEGMRIATLDAIAASSGACTASGRLRLAYVTPSHQYPLGAAMSAPRRVALLDWAARRDAWVVEDDYDSDYRYVSRPLGALQGMDTHGRVVYVGTFSKVLFPAIRIGYLVPPPELWGAFVAAREALDLFSSTLYQLALADFLREGHFARHLRRMRGVYARRRSAVLEGLARHCDGLLTVHNADAGLHVVAFLPAGSDDEAVVRALHARGVVASPLSPCYVGPSPRSGLLLGFGGADEEALARATHTLGTVLRELA